MKFLSICCILAFQLFIAEHAISQETQAAEAATNEVRAVRVETLIDDVDAGSGGLEVDAKGNIYTSDFGYRLGGGGKGGNKVFKISPDGKATLFSSEMRGASGNAIDSKGNFFQSNIGGHLITRVTPDGKASVFSKTGIKGPVGIWINSSDDLFVCNCGGASIQKITAEGQSSVFAKSELFKCPNGITADDRDNLYIANFMNGDVVKITPDGKPSKLATLPGNNNGHLTFHNGALYVVARKANQIYKVTLDGKVALFAGSGKRGKEDGAPTKATFSLPNDIAVSPDGRFMYVNEVGPVEGDHRILGPTRVRRIVLSDD